MQMIKCQSCGTQNLESSQYCDECGDSLIKYKAPDVSDEESEVANNAQSKGQEVPIYQAANVTSVGIPPVVEDLVSEQSKDLKQKDLMPDDDDDSNEQNIRTVHAKLIIERGNAIGTEFPLSSDDSTIGRWDADNGVFPDVDLDAFDPEAKVSRKHARIIYDNATYMLEDLGSTNGTFVNRGRRLIPGNPHRIQDGDEIIVGKTFLRFNIE